MRHEGGRLQFRHVYLRYQDTPHCNSTFEIDDSAVKSSGSTYSAPFPERLTTENMVTLGITDVIRYFSRQEYHFAVGFGQCFGQNWIHVVCGEPDGSVSSLWTFYDPMLARAPEHAQSMKKACSGAARNRVCVMKTLLP